MGSRLRVRVKVRVGARVRFTVRAKVKYIDFRSVKRNATILNSVVGGMIPI